MPVRGSGRAKKTDRTRIASGRGEPAGQLPRAQTPAGRRGAENFPNECRYVLELLGPVYGHDAEALERGLTQDERLSLRQERSRLVLND